MKYETVIKILTDADSEDEAVDIAGEFLRGNLESGVKIKCSTTQIRSRRLLRTCALSVLVLIFAGTAFLECFKAKTIPFSGSGNRSAFQPSLKTSQTPMFKETWQDEKERKVLEYIKK